VAGRLLCGWRRGGSLLRHKHSKQAAALQLALGQACGKEGAGRRESGMGGEEVKGQLMPALASKGVQGFRQHRQQAAIVSCICVHWIAQDPVRLEPLAERPVPACLVKKEHPQPRPLLQNVLRRTPQPRPQPSTHPSAALPPDCTTARSSA
jgi:hypothetical protein